MANINSHIFFIFVNGRSALLKAAMVPHTGAAGRLVVAVASQRGGVNASHWPPRLLTASRPFSPLHASVSAQSSGYKMDRHVPTPARLFSPLPEKCLAA
jgi:hypothetical protein